MRLEIQRYKISVVPESAQDTAYIEEVLGLHSESDEAIVRRINAHNTSTLAYIEIRNAADK